MRTRQLAWLTVLAGLALSPGCFKPPPSRIGFNEKIAKAIKKLANQGRALRKSLEPLQKGDMVPAVSVQGAVNTLGKVLEAVETEFAELEVPGKPSASAPEYLSAFQAFLKAERTIYDTNLKNIVTILQGNAPAVGKWAQVEQEFRAMTATEQGPLTALKAAQKKYADEHNYRLVDKHAN